MIHEMTTNKTILIIGSSNTDMVIKADKFPLPGETILGGKFFMFPGGKGANQAVAASRLGGAVTFITKIGNDIFGKQALQQFKNEGIRTEYVMSDSENPSGVALITVDSKGENTIVVAQGSNAALMPADLGKAQEEFKKQDIVLMQLEIPLQTVMYVAQEVHQLGKKVIFNPAPARPLPAELFKTLYAITPNKAETEAIADVQITDTKSIESAAKKIYKKGVQHVIITLGARGAFLYNNEGGRLIEAPKVHAVDSTAAGDVFNGALATALAEGANLDDAVGFANHAASISVTKMGAQASAPYRNELNTTNKHA
jgi:ribokinase